MQRIFGNKEKIDLGSSEFREFITKGNLYVDKTRFIEHIVEETSQALLFTRPRRTGKSLNLDMLRSFLDCKQDTKELFKGLYIESKPAFGQINSRPVVHLSFKELRAGDYKHELKEALMDIAYYYMHDNQFSRRLRNFFEDGLDSSRALRDLIENIHSVYGVKPYVLIDEYDKLLMDSISSSEYDTIRQWLKSVFETAPLYKVGIG